jgi:hypothetical protein
MTTPALIAHHRRFPITPDNVVPTARLAISGNRPSAPEAALLSTSGSVLTRADAIAVEEPTSARGFNPDARVEPRWERSGIDEIGIAFTAMTSGPDPAGITCTPWVGLGLPGRFMTLRELRDWMLDHPRAYDARDAVWRYLVVAARRDPQWLTAIAGMAHPALVTAAIRAGHGFFGDRRDLDNDILAGFLAAVATVDVDSGRLYERLRWAALRAGLAARWEQQPWVLVGDVESVAGAAPKLPYGHPDLIVARAVALAVIDAADADLILRTRLDATPIDEIAATTGVDPAVLRMRRQRAERALADAVTAGHLSGAVSPACRQVLDRRAARRARRAAA